MKNTKIALIALALLGFASAVSAATFTPLGFLPDGSHSVGYAVSNDGSVVAGQANGADGYQGFYWSAETGMVGVAGSESANGVAGDGSYIVGGGFYDGPYQAFQYAPDTGVGIIGGSGATGVSSDGNVIVGGGSQRWVGGVGPQTLGSLPCGSANYSVAKATNSDGSVVVGYGETCNGKKAAYRWTASTGTVSIGDLVGGAGYVEANDVSGDGSVIVGDSARSGGGREAFRWTSSGMVGLGTLGVGGEFFSVASGVSADGNTIIGRSGTDIGFQAFIWTADGGMQNLNDVLVSQGVDLQGYRLNEAFGISDDGTKIVGIAANAAGYGESFLIDLAPVPVPAAVWLFGSALGLLGWKARRQ